MKKYKEINWSTIASEGAIKCPICRELIKEKREMSAASYVIFVKTIKGKTMGIEVEPEDTLGYVKKEVQNRTHVPAEEQKFISNGKLLQDDLMLKDLGVEGNDVVQMVTELQD